MHPLRRMTTLSREVSWPLEDPAVVGEGTAFPNPPVMDPDESISWDVSELSTLDAHRSVTESDGMIVHSLQEAEVRRHLCCH